MIRKILLLLVVIFTLTNMFAQENTVFYQRIGTSRLYTSEEYENTKIVDSIRLANSKYGSVDSIVETIHLGDKKVIVFERQWKLKGGNDMTVMKILNNEKIYSMVNQHLPDFTIKDINGKTYTLDSLKGKPTLINFWFHTCGPCKAEMPVLNKIKASYGDKVNFIAITFEPKELIQPILDKIPFDFVQLINAKDYINQLSMHAAPKNIFVDKNGIIQQVYEGVDWSYNQSRTEVFLGNGKAIRDMLDKLLKD